jgi:hypothetical protein
MALIFHADGKLAPACYIAWTEPLRLRDDEVTRAARAVQTGRFV